MDTERLQNITTFVNKIKNYKGLKPNEMGYMELEDLPSCEDYSSVNIEEQIIKAMNKAAQKVISEHIPLAERKLLFVFEQVKNDYDIMSDELESVIPKETANVVSSDDPLIP